MRPNQLSRRGLLAAAGAMTAVPSSLAAIGAELSVATPAAPKDADEALALLKEGNARFAAGTTRHAHQSADWRKHLVEGQKPFATILGCSDSRVPVELVFDQGFGDLFVVRVAGNVIAPDVVGSLVYPLMHLQTQLIVVMGHEGCGAVTAALAAMSGPTKEAPGIQELVSLIEPGLPKDIVSRPAQTRISTAVEANVRWSIQQLAKLPDTKPLVDSNQVKLVGAFYELQTGRVRFLD